MRTTQEIFDRHYMKQLGHGKTKEQALVCAFEHCYDAVCIEQWTDKSIEALYQEFKAEEHKREEMYKVRTAEIERDNWIKTAVIGYHEIGKPFKVKFKNGKNRMMVAKERTGSCYGCVFCGITGYIDIRPLYGCKFKGGTHAVCSARYYAKNGIDIPLREDDKNVIYRYEDED